MNYRDNQVLIAPAKGLPMTCAPPRLLHRMVAIKKVLVTGASGFIGRSLVARLVREGIEVFALARPTTRESNLRSLSINAARIIFGDVTDYGQVASSLKRERFDAVVHLAAVVQRLGMKASRQTYFQVNVDGTRNVCEACLETGVKRFVHVSTADVHGPGFVGQLMDERSPYSPTTDYEMTKAAADKLALDYAKKGLQAIVLRPTLVYGDPYSTLFKWLFIYAQSRFIPVLGDGFALKHFVHIADLLEAILLAMDRAPPGMAYLIADETPVTINALLTIVSNVLNRKATLIHLPVQRGLFLRFSKLLPWRLGYAVSWFLTNRAYRIDAARTDFGFRPRIHLQRGLQELLEIMH